MELFKVKSHQITAATSNTSSFKRARIKLLFLAYFVCCCIQPSDQTDIVKYYKNKLEFQNGMLVQIDLNKLKENYPELTSYILNQTTPRSAPLRYKQKTTKKPEEIVQTIATYKNENNFLYYNNVTKKFEGVSMHSSYSAFKLSKQKNLTFITTTSSPFNQSLIVPLYHQFIYTIKISNSNSFDNKELIEILNEQTVESSKFRVGLIRQVSAQLGLDASSIRINWIEKLNKSSIVLLNDNLNSAEEDLEHLDDEVLEEDEEEETYTSKETDDDYNYEVEPQFISDLTQYSAEKLHRKNQPNVKSYYYILISFSDLNVLDLQKSYFLIKKSAHDSAGKAKLNQIKTKYENECKNYFKLIKQKHHDLIKTKERKFKFNFNNQTEQRTDSEKIKKVQLLKFCDLNQLTLALNSFNNNEKPIAHNKQINYPSKSAVSSLLSNTLTSFIRNSTEEINFIQVNKLVDYEANNPIDLVNSNETTFVEDNNYNILNQSTEENMEQAQIIQFKSQLSVNQTNSTDKFDESTAIGIKSWIWSIIPEEDLLLAVIVPCTIIISMIILTITVICLIQMCNNEKSKSKHLASISNGSESTHLATNTLEKPHYQFNTLKSSSMYKEKAYLSKGVPVILYEEMSDKPIDDYDENNRDIMDSPGSGGNIGTYRSNKSNYRSPCTMRNEKPPTPAPPEYIRQPTGTSYLQNDSKAVKNKNLLINSSPIQLVDNTDESIALLRKQNSYEDQSIFYQPPQPIAGLKSRINNESDETYPDKNKNSYSTVNSIQQQKQQLNFMLP